MSITAQDFKEMTKRLDTLKLDELVELLDFVDLNMKERPSLYGFYEHQIKYLIEKIIKRGDN